MTSYRKVQKLQPVDIFKDIINKKAAKNKNNDSNDNFWDIEDKNEEEISNYFNSSRYDKTNDKISINLKNINEQKKENLESFYNRLSQPKKEKMNIKYIEKKSRTIQPKEKKKKRPQSADINAEKPNSKMRTIKIDELSVFKRNQKWLQTKKDNLNRAIKKMIYKKENEIKELMKNKYIKKTSVLERYQNYNEENNVKYKQENLNYFFRLNKMREEKEKTQTPSYISNKKVNLSKYSHYSGIQINNITNKQMNKCIQIIHNKLRGKNQF